MTPSRSDEPTLEPSDAGEDDLPHRGLRGPANFEPLPRPERRRKAAGRSTPRDHQLAHQILRVLALVFPELDDDLLSRLAPVRVTPAPDASRMLVYLRPTDPELVVDVPELFERLQRARGHLRAEVAAEVNRKRTPELVFSLATDEELLETAG